MLYSWIFKIRKLWQIREHQKTPISILGFGLNMAEICKERKRRESTNMVFGHWFDMRTWFDIAVLFTAQCDVIKGQIILANTGLNYTYFGINHQICNRIQPTNNITTCNAFLCDALAKKMGTHSRLVRSGYIGGCVWTPWTFWMLARKLIHKEVWLQPRDKRPIWVKSGLVSTVIIFSKDWEMNAIECLCNAFVFGNRFSCSHWAAGCVFFPDWVIEAVGQGCHVAGQTLTFALQRKVAALTPWDYDQPIGIVIDIMIAQKCWLMIHNPKFDGHF